MSKRIYPSYLCFSLCLLAVAMLSGCTGRKIITATEDQSFVPGAAPQAPVVEEAKVSPPAPPPAEPPKEEIPAVAPVEPPKVEAPPTTPPPDEEIRITEQPIAPPPPPPPAVEPAHPAPEPAVEPAPQPAAEPAAPVAELSDVFFDFDRFTIRNDARASLEADAGVLKTQSETKIQIEGHCDERGTSAYNLVLGERRAQAVRKYLLDLGVPSSQIKITSYGKERPFCTEHSEDCWQSNRRAHFTRQ
jgi:peptidoglycan-associated lipoprotein